MYLFTSQMLAAAVFSPVQSQESETLSSSPMWVGGTPMFEQSSAASTSRIHISWLGAEQPTLELCSQLWNVGVPTGVLCHSVCLPHGHEFSLGLKGNVSPPYLKLSA